MLDTRERRAGSWLVADVGGTWSRFALTEAAGHLGQVVEMPTRDLPPAEVVGWALGRLDQSRVVRTAVIAVAGPVSAERAELTNLSGAVFDAAAIAAEVGLGEVTLINDFEAVAHALPLLGDRDRLLVGGPPEGCEDAPMLVLGPGTGLGVAYAVPDGRGDWRVLAAEGGHAALPARNETEWTAIERLGGDAHHLSAERVCSGPGLTALYRVVEEPVLRADDEAPSPPAIAELARQGDRRALAALRLFAEFLGTVAGDAALILGARRGVYLAGGVLPGLGTAFDWSRFHRRFIDKGRFSAYLAAIPVVRVTHPHPGLLGLTALRSATPRPR